MPRSKEGKKVKFDPRSLMEKAVEVMRQSVAEPRQDDKANPKVGAVLWKPDGSIETACRGELRYGDHAEFTLLERKNRTNKLDGSIMFATLEPCAPNSRHPRKMGCAERIHEARIKEIWVGIADPDPTVDRKGIKFLQDCGVKVHMFDRDLQEVIKNENKDFFEQALDRASATETEKTEKITLSSMEEKWEAASLNDLSTAALEEYRRRADIRDEIDSASFKRRMGLQGLLKEDKEGQFTPTGFGMLLFAENPRDALQQAGLLATHQYPDGKEETNNFEGPMVLLPDEVEEWLKPKLPNVNDRSTMRRTSASSPPFEMIREGVVNALIHRDYDIREAKCQLIVTPDTITIKSPGAPLPSVSIEQLQQFNAPMLSRNPELHYVFSRMEIAEERGFGIKSLREDAQKANLPLPRYEWLDPYLVLTLYRTPEAAESALKPEISESLSKTELAGWHWLAKQDTVTAAEYANGMDIPRRTALNHLKRFTDLGLVKKTGSGRSTRYQVV